MIPYHPHRTKAKSQKRQRIEREALLNAVLSRKLRRPVKPGFWARLFSWLKRRFR